MRDYAALIELCSPRTPTCQKSCVYLFFGLPTPEQPLKMILFVLLLVMDQQHVTLALYTHEALYVQCLGQENNTSNPKPLTLDPLVLASAWKDVIKNNFAIFVCYP